MTDSQDLSPWSEQFYVKCFLPMLRRDFHHHLIWPCLSWVGAVNKDGYGIIVLPDMILAAHFYSLRMIGVDPGGHVIRHLCDNRRCCNPVHFLLGTPQENQDDRQAHGSRNGNRARAFAPFAPNYRPSTTFLRPSNPWTRPLGIDHKPPSPFDPTAAEIEAVARVTGTWPVLSPI